MAVGRTPWPARLAVPPQKRTGLPRALQEALQPRRAPLRPAKAGPTAPEPPTKASWCSAPAGCCERSAGHQALACAPTASSPLAPENPPAPDRVPCVERRSTEPVSTQAGQIQRLRCNVTPRTRVGASGWHLHCSIALRLQLCLASPNALLLSGIRLCACLCTTCSSAARCH